MNFRKYGRKMLELKGVKLSRRNLEHASFSLKKAYNTVYKAVAFDIDGTLTDPNSTEIDQLMALEIANLLQKSVPVLLITGRGRATARKAVNQILEKANLNPRYASRLSCIVHNGLMWIKASPNNLGLILAEEIRLPFEPLDIKKVKELILSDNQINRNVLSGELNISEEPSDTPGSIRLIFKDNSTNLQNYLLHNLETILNPITVKNKAYIMAGKFGTLFSIDITPTNKVKAMEAFSEFTGIQLQEILRVGDRGDETGNDFEILNSSRGFSVDSLSMEVDKCFPILDDSLQFQLKGVDATKILLRRIKIYPPLTLVPDPDHKHLRSLHLFERDAVLRTKREFDLLFSKMKLRITRLLLSNPPNIEVESVNSLDIFEYLNGGIRMRDWEVTELSANHPVRQLFGLSDEVLHKTDYAQLEWALFTDDSIMLRGPKYYWAMTDSTKAAGYIKRYSSDVISFLENARVSIQALSNEGVSFAKFKFVLGIMDNIRNILIQFQYAVYISDTIAGGNYDHTRSFFNIGLAKHTEFHLSAILDSNIHWKIMLTEYENLLEEILRLAQRFSQLTTPYEHLYRKSLIRKWRECDDFLQNILAVEIGLHEFEETILRTGKTLDHMISIGLVYGGIELPAIALAISKNKGFSLSCGYMNFSLYGNQGVREELLQGNISVQDIIANQEDIFSSLVFLDKKHTKAHLTQGTVIIMDDNCTTGRTIQAARDILVQHGADVIGAIAVRYSPSNRYVQMQFPNHGLPDPEILMTFIRGLVSPSPYTRLTKLNADLTKRYLDSTGIFDLSRWQLERHLLKNSGSQDFDP